MDPEKINELLQEVRSRQYRVKVGEVFEIELPKIPMMEDTEFLQLVMESEEDEGSDGVTEEAPQSDPGEGSLQPVEIKGVARKAGKKRYRIRAVDAISQEEIEGVAPLEIELEVTDHDHTLEEE